MLAPTDRAGRAFQVGLFTNVSSGIADVFYEPYKGAVMHGNKELGIGIAKVIYPVDRSFCGLF
jgi:Vacuolar-sorting-associated 13 protein, DH-like domain